MKSFFRKIDTFRKRKKFLKKFKFFLKNGKYLGDSRAKVFYLKKNHCSERFCMENLKRKISYNVFKRWLFQCNLKTKTKNYDGDIIVFGNTLLEDVPASVKVFNMDKQEVLTLYLDEKKMERDLRAYEYMSEKLPLVPTLSKDIENKAIKEKLIIGRSIVELNEEDYLGLFENIIRHYVRYFKNEPVKKAVFVDDLFNEAIAKGFDKEIQTQISLQVNNLKNKKIPLKVLHGDFTYSNLLLDGKDFYFIDFEHFGDYCFYYDIFWLMQNEYVYENKPMLMQRYFEGELDSIFRMLFESVGEYFDDSLRAAYYYIFLLDMFNKRVYNLKEKEVVFNYIKKIFKHFLLSLD